MNLELQSMAIQLPAIADHPNRAPFRGVLTVVGVPSDQPPAGANNHRVLLTRAATERALPSLLGMALDYTPSLDGHDARRKIGVITEAEIHRVDGMNGVKKTSCGCPTLVAPAVGATGWAKDECSDPTLSRQKRPGQGWGNQRSGNYDHLAVSGYLYAKDFPDVLEEIRAAAGKLGMSYEITHALVANRKAPVWELTEFTFTGAALLRRDKAAYRQTWMELTPQLAIGN